MAKAGLNFMEAVLTSFWLSLYFSSWTLESALWDGGEGGMAGERESLFFQTTKTWRLVPDFSPGGQGFNMWIWRGCNSAPKDFQYLSWITLFFKCSFIWGRSNDSHPLFQRKPRQRWSWSKDVCFIKSLFTAQKTQKDSKGNVIFQHQWVWLFSIPFLLFIVRLLYIWMT